MFLQQNLAFAETCRCLKTRALAFDENAFLLRLAMFSASFSRRPGLMAELVAKCGMDCRACPWGSYPRQDMTPEEFEQYKKRAKKILGYTPMKTACFTCQVSNEEIPKGHKLPPRNCLVRQCVDKIGVENCAYCSRFPCGQVKDIAGAWNRKFFEEKLGAPISEEDYVAFVKPFEGMKRLEEIRASTGSDDLVEAPTAPPLKAKIIEFPKDLPFSEEETAAFKALHELLASVKRSSLGLKDTDVFAQQQRLKNRIPVFMRTLWVLGRFGKLKEEDGVHLVVDAKTYLDNRGNPRWSFVKDVLFKILSEFEVRCERVVLKGAKEKDLTTPGGYLRGKGWMVRMTFDGKAGGVVVLRALQAYAKRLDEKYGKRAFRHFSNADMQILRKDRLHQR